MNHGFYNMNQASEIAAGKALAGWLVLSAVWYSTDAEASNVYPHTDPGNLGNWILQEQVSDEFDGTVLDEDKWQVCGRDGVYWNNQFSGRSYDPSSYDTGWEYNPDNLRVANGSLYIKTEYDPAFAWQNDPYGNNEFTTGGMWSKQLSGATGYMEIRCRLADASTVGAFWTTAGSGSPPCEIDVFEGIGSPAWNLSRTNKMWSSLHDWSKPTPNSAWTDTTDLPFRFRDGFHTYAAEWGEDYLKIYADGQLIHETTKAWVESVGHDSQTWPLPGGQHIWADAEIFPWWGIPNPANLPAEHQIEYIRVWEKGPPTLWSQYAAAYGLSGVKTNHSDADSLNDWGEYVFNGNPTNPADVGIRPHFDAAAGDYTFQLRNDTNIVARVVTGTDLMQAGGSTNDTVKPALHDGLMDTYVRAVGTSDPNLFIRLLLDEGSVAPPSTPVYQIVIGDGGAVGVPSSGNGNFEAITTSGDPIAMSEVPNWFAVGRDETQTFGTINGMDGSPEPESKGCYIFQSYIAANDTGYTVQSAGETFSLGIAHNRHGNLSNYTGDEKVVLYLFTSTAGVDGDTVIGDITIMNTTKFDIDSNAWPMDSADNVYTTTASDVGKTFYLGLTLENPSSPYVYPRCDVVQLEVNK